jgi:hypothetical protein
MNTNLFDIPVSPLSVARCGKCGCAAGKHSTACEHYDHRLVAVGEILRIDDPKAKHSYEVQVSRTDYAKVAANNRTQAAKLVKARGFEVLSVNFVG